MRIEDDATANRVCRRVAADHESIAAHGDERRLEPHLHKCARAWTELRAGIVDESDAAEELVGEVVEAEPRLLLERLGVGEQIETRGDDLRWPQRVRREKLL